MASGVLTQDHKRLKLGPANFGRRLSEKQFLQADYEGGYHYELIEGRLYVVTLPRQSHHWLERWLADLLQEYAKHHPQIINHVEQKAVVYIPEAEDVTRPEPDIAAYHEYPFERGPDFDWDDVSPILVVEVLSEGGLEKDLERNVGLYARVPSIREYWVLDGLADPRQPALIVRRRKGKSWQVRTIRFGEKYTTSLLPGFELVVNPTSK